MLASRAMQRHEKVAERAGSLVTERVRAVIETAQARADRVQRTAADETDRLDSHRMQAASRIVSQIADLEGTLGRLRQQMQSEHAMEGSYVDEGRLIEAVQEREVDAPAGPTATSGVVTPPVEEPPVAGGTALTEEEQDPPAEEVEELAAEVQDLADEVKELKAEVLERTAEAEAEEVAAAPEPEPEPEPESLEPEPESLEPEPEPLEPEPESLEPEEQAAIAEDIPAIEEEPEALPEQATQEAYACGVCGRGFAGNEDELESLGWVVSESGAVTCADCHSAGWLRPGT